MQATPPTIGCERDATSTAGNRRVFMASNVKTTLGFAWIGFLMGGVSALLFYLRPFSFLAHTCLFCFGFDFDATRMFLVVLTSALVLMNGSIYGLVGFGIGCIVSRIKVAGDQEPHRRA
jgi:hypothetical protein